MSEPNFRAFLIGRPAVVALTQQRIYAQLMPQHEQDGPQDLPCVTFTLVGSLRHRTLCGTNRLVEGTWQFDAWSDDRDEAVALGASLRRELVDYTGLMGDTFVDMVALSVENDAGPDPEPGLYRRSQTFTIWYLED